jgi:hypothetical protein
MPVIEEDIFGLGKATDFSKAISEMFSGDIKNLRMKTDLSPRQICNLNVSKQMADTYDVPLLKALYYRFLGLRVSKERKGRVEAVSMTQSILQMKRLEMIENQLEGQIRK